MESLFSSIDEIFSLKTYWQDYNIATCQANIQNAVKVIKEQTPTSSWKKSWPNKVTHDHEGFIPDEVHHSAVDRAVRLARLVATEGFSDMIKEEVNTLIDCHSNPRTDEDLER